MMVVTLQIPAPWFEQYTLLLGFAIMLPIVGIFMFRYMERAVRQIGSLNIG
jgi:hypothetical protein